MDKLVEEWYLSKKKTYHKVWETKQGWAWCLFFTEGYTGCFHSGMEDTEREAENEIMWGIASELRKRELI